MSEATDPYCLTDEKAADLLAGHSWRRFAGIGDSVVEGIREPFPGYRDESWIDRLLRWARLAAPELAELNLGRRDLRAAQIRATQLAPAVDFAPDLAVVFAGGNDMFRRDFDEAAVAADLSAMVGALRDLGCTVITLSAFDISRAGIVPERYAARSSERIRRLGALTGSVAARHGALFVDFNDHPLAKDPTVYSSDLVHLNARGHAVVAAEVLRHLAANPA
jgi:lysophospholipase L1-like esterase